MGLRVGLAGNQTARAEGILKSLDLPVDVIGTSDGWGVEKPLAGFFARVVEEAGCVPGSVLYVGDRLDNDIRPAQKAGLGTALIRRGPWDDEPVRAGYLFELASLAELPGVLRARNSS